MLHFKNFSLDLDSDAVILDKECKNDYTETLKKFKTIPEQILNLSLLGFTPVHFNNEISNVELDDLSVILLPTEIKLQKSWIVKGGCIKSINQFYNKKLAKRKSVLETVNNQKTSR